MLANGDRNQAEALTRELIASETAAGSDYQRLAGIFADTGRFGDARAAIAAGLKRFPHDEGVLRAKCRISVLTQDPADSLSTCLAIYKDNPAESDAAFFAGISADLLGDANAADKYLRWALAGIEDPGEYSKRRNELAHFLDVSPSHRLQRQQLKARRLSWLEKEWNQRWRDVASIRIQLEREAGADSSFDKTKELRQQVIDALALVLGQDGLPLAVEHERLGNEKGAAGRHSEAIGSFSIALGILRKQGSSESPMTARLQSNIGAQRYMLGQYELALDHQAASVELTKRLFGDASDLAMFRARNLANTFYQLGRTKDALDVHERVLMHYTNKHGENHDETLSSMNGVAAMYLRLGRLQEARSLQERVLSRRSASLGDAHRETMLAMGNLASIYSAQGLVIQALELRRRQVEGLAKAQGRRHLGTISALGNLAEAYSQSGELGKAVELGEEAVALSGEAQGLDSLSTLGWRINLAKYYRQLGSKDLALKLQEETASLQMKRWGPAHRQTFVSQIGLAQTYAALDRHFDAIRAYNRVLDNPEALASADARDVVNAAGELAASYLATGLTGEAVSAQRKVIARLQNLLGDLHPDTLVARHNLAAMLTSQGESTAAASLLREIHAAKRRHLGEQHTSTLETLQALASALWKAGQSKEAVSLALEFVAATERVRATPVLWDGARASYLAAQIETYLEFAGWLAETDDLEKSFDLVDLTKARGLVDEIRSASAAASLAQQDRFRLDGAVSAERKARLLLDEALTSRSTPQQLSAAQAEWQSAKETSAALLTMLRKQSPNFARVSELQPPVSVKSAKTMLRPNEVFVSISVRRNGRAYAYLVRRDDPVRRIQLGGLLNFEHTVAATREVLGSQAEGAPRHQLITLLGGGFAWKQLNEEMPFGGKVAAGTREEAAALLQAYWQERLVEPLRPELQRDQRWIISPDRELALLPFDALFMHALDAGQRKYLVETHTLSLIQSFGVLASLKARERQYERIVRNMQLLAFGNAFYNDGWPDRRPARLQSPGTVAEQRNATQFSSPASIAITEPTGSVDRPQIFWENLPGTATEVNAVAKRFSNAAPGQKSLIEIFSGLAASELTLRRLSESGKLRQFKYLLFSGHGHVSNRPSDSALVLSQRGNPQGVDGYVTAAEWPVLDMRSDLVVLSACDTAVGRAVPGDAVAGLPYALFVAGNTNTLLTLWPVDDDATAKFMELFFAEVVGGATHAEALSETKRAFRKLPRLSDPRFWAGFVLFGT
ncbi:CHAT domain-containing protein [Rubrivivax rivuli]|uniref:CHAT domain-containing protein n=1 Tax=Rubrivivax rivuli TaxID=1862385 RepID=UPI00196A2E62|nr:CHAT domain-containing protein [Rubrivivax rivuli]